jgi:polyribonucleotide nucleotidyltransferase
MDKIGEVIGPKGKVINTITQETGADVSVSDDGVVGTVSIGSKDGEAVAEAQRRIELILDPPTAELGATYTGKVVNITKFGAFVNVLPGRDGLLHISKIGGGKRIDRVEDVLNLGDEVEVRVDDIDNSGKLSLSLASDEPPAPGEGASAPRERSRDDRPRDRDDRPRRGRSDRDGGNGSDRDRGGSESGASAERPDSNREVASFEDQWENQAKAEFGDLGPEEATRSGGGGGGGRRGGGGGGRRRR